MNYSRSVGAMILSSIRSGASLKHGSYREGKADKIYDYINGMNMSRATRDVPSGRSRAQLLYDLTANDT
jgi:hypothetical protein